MRKIGFFGAMVAMIMIMGCAYSKEGLDNKPAGTSHCIITDLSFFHLMQNGYETTFPDQEGVLYTKGFCVIGGEKIAMFCWRGQEGRVNAVLNAQVKFVGGKKKPISINVSGIDRELTGQGQWIPDQREVGFTYLSMGNLEESKETEIKMFERLKELKHFGIRHLELPLPQR